MQFYWCTVTFILLYIINGWFWSILNSKIVSDTMWSAKPKVFACWPFRGKVCWPMAQSNGSHFGAILPSRGRLASSRDGFVCHSWGWGSIVCYWHLVALQCTTFVLQWSSATMYCHLGMLQCTGRPPQQRIIWSQKTVVLRLRKWIGRT